MDPATWIMLGSLALQGGSMLMNSGGESLNQVPSKTPQQIAHQNNMLKAAQKMMESGGGYNNAENFFNKFLGPNQEEEFGKFSEPYLQKFNEQMLPNIAERFAGNGALSSSAFGQALGGASAGLQSDLARMFTDLQSQAAQANYNQFNNLSGQGMEDQFAYYQQPGGGGKGSGFAQGINPQTMYAMANMMPKNQGTNQATMGGGVSGINTKPNYNVNPGYGGQGQYNLPTFMQNR